MQNKSTLALTAEARALLNAEVVTIASNSTADVSHAVRFTNVTADASHAVRFR